MFVDARLESIHNFFNWKICVVEWHCYIKTVRILTGKPLAPYPSHECVFANRTYRCVLMFKGWVHCFDHLLDCQSWEQFVELIICGFVLFPLQNKPLGDGLMKVLFEFFVDLVPVIDVHFWVAIFFFLHNDIVQNFSLYHLSVYLKNCLRLYLIRKSAFVN